MRLSYIKSSLRGKQPYFKDEEFEVMMDVLRHSCGGEVFNDGAGIDVDLVLLKAYGIEPDFVPMAPELLGRTKFYPDGSAVIEINRKLADAAEVEDIARRRLRTTLAHEAGHICCHRDIFLKDTSTLSLFDDPMHNKMNQVILCRQEAVGNRHYAGEWWEYQANRCMASLLLPKHLIKEKVDALLGKRQELSMKDAIRKGTAVSVIRRLADVFDVSFEATVYRLKDLGYIPDEFQMDLDLM
ncbi:hypothetical protein TRIP_C20067 [Candidatus Zixiibacteriota bacterium]|nr:hypothetical protein TRIP_C20067 [candidate division Zixibacteria bacterium]